MTNAYSTVSYQQSAIKHRSGTIRGWEQLVEQARVVLKERKLKPSLTIETVAALLYVSPRTLQRAFDSCSTDYTREHAEARWATAERFLSLRYDVATTARWTRHGPGLGRIQACRALRSRRMSRTSSCESNNALL